MGTVGASSEQVLGPGVDAELTSDEFRRDAFGRDAARLDGLAAANLAEWTLIGCRCRCRGALVSGLGPVPVHVTGVGLRDNRPSLAPGPSRVR